jgi:uncharacterized protein (DUF1684 family)
MTDTRYSDEVQQFRDARDERLKTNPQSWLALIGLFRLAEGENTFGADEKNKIVLTNCGQPHCGSFVLDSGNVTLISRSECNLTVNDFTPGPRILHTDHDEETDLIRVGRLTMMILLRGKDHYLRIWDRESPAIIEFTGLKHFPIKPEYRIVANFLTYVPLKVIKIQDVIGTEFDGHLAGEAHFNLNGNDCRLVAEESGEELLFSFTDETRNDSTYPGGRYLVTKMPKDGQVILDFNRAVNWPCAYTAYATCPLPPAENKLPVRIEAGEMRYQEH